MSNLVKIVASTGSYPDGSEITEYAPDLIELRLDLMGTDGMEMAASWHEETDIPLVMTLRSSNEGGSFSGSAEEWWSMVKPVLPFASYVDIEQGYAAYAADVKDFGCTVVSSFHTMSMPTAFGLREIHKVLRAYGNIPKIVVSPGNSDQVLDFLAFTCHAEKPLITSIMGEQFRHIRAVLPLFGSSWVFGHGGKPTSAGQFRVDELKSLFAILDG